MRSLPFLEMKHFAAGHDFLRGLVEGDALAGADGGGGHDGGDGMLVASLDGCVGFFAGAQAFEPIFHVRGGEGVGSHIRGGGGGGGLAERVVGEQVGLHLHFGGFLGCHAAVRGDFVGREVELAAV